MFTTLASAGGRGTFAREAGSAPRMHEVRSGARADPVTITPQRADVPAQLDPRTATLLGGADPALRSLADRILRDHPEVDPLRVLILVLEAHATTADAPVQNYRLVLAERCTRRLLRAERDAASVDRGAPPPSP